MSYRCRCMIDPLCVNHSLLNSRDPYFPLDFGRLLETGDQRKWRLNEGLMGGIGGYRISYYPPLPDFTSFSDSTDPPRLVLEDFIFTRQL
jgi:hypothetical protein